MRPKVAGPPLPPPAEAIAEEQDSVLSGEDEDPDFVDAADPASDDDSSTDTDTSTDDGSTCDAGEEAVGPDDTAEQKPEDEPDTCNEAVKIYPDSFFFDPDNGDLRSIADDFV